MKRLKSLACLALALVMVFSLTACGSTFDGNYKEVTGEDYNNTVAEVKTAYANGGVDSMLEGKSTSGSKSIRLADANSTATVGAKAELNMTVSYKKGDKEYTVETKNTQNVGVNDSKVVVAATSSAKINKAELKAEAYSKDGDLYVRVKSGDKDNKIKVTTLLSGAFSLSLEDLVDFDELNAYAAQIVTLSAESLNSIGVKVYVDKGDETMKVKYVLDQEAFKKLISDKEDYNDSAFKFKEYYVIIVLDNNKGVAGVKVVCDVQMTVDEAVVGTKLEGYVERSDKAVKLPSLDDYSEVTVASGLDTVTTFTSFFAEVAGVLGM